MRLTKILTLIILILGDVVFWVPQAAAAPPNDFFTPEASFPGVQFGDVFGVGSVVYAVGHAATGAVIYKRTAGVWALDHVAGSSFQGYSSIWASSSSDVWAVTSTFISHYNGSTWTDTPLLSVCDATDKVSMDIWGSSSSRVQIAYTGINGQTAATEFGYQCLFTTYPSVSNHNEFTTSGAFFATTQALPSVFITSTNRFFVFDGPDGTPIYRCSDICSSTDAPLQVVTGVRIKGIWGSSSTNVWAVGSQNLAYHYTGSIFVPENTGAVSCGLSPTSELDAVFGLSSSNIYAVGQCGNVVHYDGTAWSAMPITRSEAYASVWFLDSTNGWAVGNGFIDSYQVVPAASLPTLAGLTLDTQDIQVWESQAQCLGDEVGFNVNIDKGLGGGGLHLYVIDDDSNLVVQTYDTVGGPTFPHTLNNNVWYGSITLPKGEYTFVATADETGALEQDDYAATHSSVPGGNCFTPFDENLLQQTCSTVNSCSTTGSGGDLQLSDLSVQQSWTLIAFAVLFLVAAWHGWKGTMLVGAIGVMRALWDTTSPIVNSGLMSMKALIAFFIIMAILDLWVDYRGKIREEQKVNV